MRRRLLVTCLTVSVTLVGCGSDESGAPSRAASSPSETEAKSESRLPDPEECSDPDVYAEWTEYCANLEAGSEMDTEEPPPAVNPQFGETYVYENGLEVTISAPQPYAPSEYAFVGEPAPPAFVVFDITVTNGSQTNYEPGIFSVTLQSGSVEGEQVYDSANGVGGTPSTTLLPGRDSVFRMAFGVTDPDDLVLEVTPGFDYESAIFTS